jgi:hypothetical protein
MPVMARVATQGANGALQLVSQLARGDYSTEFGDGAFKSPPRMARSPRYPIHPVDCWRRPGSGQPGAVSIRCTRVHANP